MDRLQELLQRGRKGNAVLFCGAGLTADCLNFEDMTTLGASSQLLRLLNDELKANGEQSGFSKLANAAKQFKKDLGRHRLMLLLQDRFRLSHVSASVIDIVRYPWTAIYTTNYDNGLDLALQRARKKFVSLNNLDEPRSKATVTEVIHLHGRAEVWNDTTFEQSCVLDADSYRSLTGVRTWLPRLRLAIDRSEVVVFVGFSASDFHLEEVFFNVAGLKEKAFFINSPVAKPDPDEHAIQEDFGVPLYIGREDFAQIVTETLQSEAPKEPSLASFRRFRPAKPHTTVPPVTDIEDLFLWGEVVPEHVKRDCDLSNSGYHVLRDEVREIQNSLDDAGRIVLAIGDICAGKSLVILGTMNNLAGVRPVFELCHPYDDLLDETAAILSAYSNAVLVVENCFSIHVDRLLGMARQIAASDGGLLLSARSISTEAEPTKLRKLKAISSFREIQVGPIAATEADALIALIDQIAGWRSFQAWSDAERRQFVSKECGGIIPSVLLRLLDSEYVRTKYREEYQKTNYLDVQERRMVVAALLISNIGFDAPLSLISDVFERDFTKVLRKMSDQSGGLRLVRATKGMAQTVPSIGARNLLKSVIEDREVVNTTIKIVEMLADDLRRSDLRGHIFSQLMRYSILNSVVKDADEVNRFFDHISKIANCRNRPLFWLQWHVAMCAQKKWIDAEKYLDMGYTAADGYERKRKEKYHRRQLDDRKAKFLAARSIELPRSGAELFRDLKAALDIASRLLGDTELTHHPFETLLDIGKALQEKGSVIGDSLQGILTKQFCITLANAERKVGVVAAGYQRNHAENTIERIQTYTFLHKDRRAEG